MRSSLLTLATCCGIAFLPILPVHAATLQVTLHDGTISPAQIQVQKGESVHITVRNSGKQVHNFVIPDFYIFTQNLNAGQTVDVQFSPDKTGSYPYYSDKQGIPEPGMKGQIQVKP